ncbi:MAG: ribonuclease HII [Clostridia bacterium]|nr:ribonuclease HII [Clostridia bacterium]
MADIIDKLKYEKRFSETGMRYIAGIDEVGRGPLAGPVVCAVVIMPLDENSIIEGVDDSKKLSEKKRKSLAEKIKAVAVDYKICEVSPEEIDEINILQATIKCMKNCVDALNVKPDMLLVDAVKADFSVPSTPIVKGDALSYSIGAASIIAKVYRDELMEKYAEIYPGYGFEKHKGYGTKAHVEAIGALGACPIHRKTFIKNFVK